MNRSQAAEIDRAFLWLCAGGIAHLGLFLLVRTVAAGTEGLKLVQSGTYRAVGFALIVVMLLGYTVGSIRALTRTHHAPMRPAAAAGVAALVSALLANFFPVGLQEFSRGLFAMLNYAFVVLIPVILVLAVSWYRGAARRSAD